MVQTNMQPKTCAEAIAAFDRGETIKTINISGFGWGGYEYACQRLMLTAIREQIDHEGDVVYWDGLVGSDSSECFPKAHALACAEDMTGAMWGHSISTAVVMLRNTWSGGMAKVPAERVIDLTMDGS